MNLKNQKTVIAIIALYITIGCGSLLYTNYRLLPGRHYIDNELWIENCLIIVPAIIFYFLMRFYVKKISTYERSYEILFKKSPIPILTYDPDSLYILDVNEAALMLYGYSKQEFLKVTVLNLCSPEDRQELLDFLRREKQKSKLLKITKHYKKDGSPIYVRAHANDVLLNDNRVTVMTIDDVTQEFLYRKEIEKLSLVASETNNIVIISDRRGQIEWVNQAFEDLTGRRLSEVRGLRPEEILAGIGTDKKIIEHIRTNIEKKIPVNSNFLVYNKKGGSFWVRANISIVKADSQNLEKIVIVAQDITEGVNHRLKIEDQNQVLMQIADLSAHQIRGPLSNILGIVELYRQDREKIYEDQYFSHIESSAEKLDRVIKTVVDMCNMIDLN